MPTSAEPLAALSVRPETPLGPRDLPRRIQITDANLSLVAKGFGELNAVELPTGIYQARVESQERPFEQMVFLTPGESRSLTYPLQSGDKLDSPAPVPGSEAMHESLREPLDLAIRRLSVGPYDARILLMATRPERAEPSINFTGFRVLDSQGSEEAWVEESLHLGESPYRLLSCEVKAGGFVLEGVAENFPPDTRLRQPLWCSPGWATVVFLGVGASGSPDLNTASIYLWHIGNAFAPESSRYGNVAPDSTIAILENQRSTELALHSLVTGRSLLSLKEIDRQLLYQKFGNPMLGILGCHLLLGQPASDRELLPAVLNNLELLVPGHPDVTALRALARQAVVQDPNAEAPKSDWPPMLRAGFHALRDLDWRRTGTIVPGSLFDAVRTRLLSGGVWTRWIAQGKAEFDRGASTESVTAGTLRKRHPYLSRFIRQLKSLRPRKVLRPIDLEWSGLSRPQAQSVVDLLSGGPVVGRMAAARQSAPALARKKKKAARKSVKAVKPARAPAPRKKSGRKGTAPRKRKR